MCRNLIYYRNESSSPYAADHLLLSKSCDPVPRASSHSQSHRSHCLQPTRKVPKERTKSSLTGPNATVVSRLHAAVYQLFPAPSSCRSILQCDKMALHKVGENMVVFSAKPYQTLVLVRPWSSLRLQSCNRFSFTLGENCPLLQNQKVSHFQCYGEKNVV